VLKDWSKARLKQWLTVPVEDFRKTTRGEIALNLSLKMANSTRAYVARDVLFAAVRTDIKRHLRPKYQNIAEQITPLLQICMNHQRLFRFQPFGDLFVRQIVPFQVLRRGHLACHFSPARLVGFGLP
jgi:hypothetical protein